MNKTVEAIIPVIIPFLLRYLKTKKKKIENIAAMNPPLEFVKYNAMRTKKSGGAQSSILFWDI